MGLRIKLKNNALVAHFYRPQKFFNSECVCVWIISEQTIQYLSPASGYRIQNTPSEKRQRTQHKPPKKILIIEKVLRKQINVCLWCATVKCKRKKKKKKETKTGIDGEFKWRHINFLLALWIEHKKKVFPFQRKKF